MSLKNIPGKKYLAGMILGLGVVYHGAVNLDAPTIPQDISRVREINQELQDSPFSDITLEDVTEYEMGITGFFGLAQQNAKNLVAERDSLESLPGYKSQEETYNLSCRKHERDLGYLIGIGALIALGSASLIGRRR